MADGAPLEPGSTLAFVGLGRMGQPMTRRLLDAGYRVRGYDVVPAARDAFGGDTAATPVDAAHGAGALILMLPDTSAVREVLGSEGVLEALPPGALVVDMGSSEPMQTRELAAAIERHGLVPVDAPVSGGVIGAESGKLTIMVGGDASAVARIRPVLDCLGASVVHVGGTGAGHALKALNNFLSATHLLATVEAFRVGRRFGLDPETMLAAINGSSGRSFSTELKLPRYVLPESFDSGFSLRLMDKDLQTALGLARALGSRVPLGEAAGELWARAARELDAGADHTEIALWSASTFDPASH